MPKVSFVRENQSVTVNSGANLRKTTLAQGFSLYKGSRKLLNCHGFGLCGTCVVEITEGADKLSPMTRSEEKLLRQQNLEPGRFRLACQANIHHNVKVKTLGN